MLQQTRVEVVRDYYERWMLRFPTLGDLARAQDSDVLHLWQGLGYYSRARRLLSGARFVIEHFGGQLPRETARLLRVPGIGPYSAGAISSIAFGQPSAIVDGNVIRVLSRHGGLGGDPNKSPLKALLWERAGQLVALADPGAFNQALMELGATVCTPKRPQCFACPVRESCVALATNEVQRFPELPLPKPKTKVRLVVLLLQRVPARGAPRSEYAFVTLPADARWWAQLQAPPFCVADDAADPQEVALQLASQYATPDPQQVHVLEPVRHTVTRFDVELVPVVVGLKPGRASRVITWVAPTDLADLALPSAHRKVLRRLEEFRQEDAPRARPGRGPSSRKRTA
jgi:A/G-specific adenine glycosylase